MNRGLYGFMALRVFNATVVFEQGWIRWAGLAGFAGLAALWLGRGLIYVPSRPRGGV